MMTKAQARGIAASRDISWLSGCLHSTGRRKTKFLACVKSFTRNFGGMHDIAREVGTFNHPVFAATTGQGNSVNITGTTFGQTTTLAVPSRNLQLRLAVQF